MGGGGYGQLAAAGAKDVASILSGLAAGLSPGQPAMPYGPAWQQTGRWVGEELAPQMISQTYDLMGAAEQDRQRAARGQFDIPMQKAIDYSRHALMGLSPAISSAQFQQQMAPMYAQLKRQYAGRGVSPIQMTQMQNQFATQNQLQALQAKRQGSLGMADFMRQAYSGLSQQAQAAPLMAQMVPALATMAGTFAPMTQQPAKPSIVETIAGALSAGRGGGGGGKGGK
jgi:hypothetical protein